MAELLVSGRLERATALLQLEELRQSLKLDDDDHWAAIQELAPQDRRVLELTGQQREIRSLCQEAAREAMLKLLRLTRLDDLQQLLSGLSQRAALAWEWLIRVFGGEYRTGPTGPGTW